MSYDYNKKCKFPKMGNKIIPVTKKKKTHIKTNQSQTLKDWKDGWFKGEYESKR